jgi:hypothetical protein
MTAQEQADELVATFLPLVRAKMTEDYKAVYRRARVAAYEHVVLLQAELKKLGVRTPHWTKVKKELE